MRGATEEGQGGFRDGRGVGAHPLVHRAETLPVVAGVGEDDVGAVPQQESVGELLVDDADVAGDDDGPGRQPERGEAVQHRLDGAADEGEDDDVVTLVAHGVQELDGRHLTHPVGVDADVADLGELAGCRGRPAAEQQSADLRTGRGRAAVARGRSRRAVSAPHFQRVSESARTATRRALVFSVRGGTSQNLGRHFDSQPNVTATAG